MFKDIFAIIKGEVASYESSASFPTIGNIKTIYVDQTSLLLYLWNGTAYVVANNGDILDGEVRYFNNLPSPASSYTDQTYYVKQYDVLTPTKLSGFYRSDSANWVRRSDKVIYSLLNFTGANKIVKTNNAGKEVIETAIEIDSNNNLNLKAGGFKDENVSTAIKLGSASETAFDTSDQTIIGSSNELHTNIATVQSNLNTKSHNSLYGKQGGGSIDDFNHVSDSQLVKINNILPVNLSNLDNNDFLTHSSDTWVNRTPTVVAGILSHNNLSTLQGGSSSERYHLTSTQVNYIFANSLTSLANNDVLLYNSSNARFENETLDNFKTLLGSGIQVGNIARSSTTEIFNDTTISIYWDGANLAIKTSILQGSAAGGYDTTKRSKSSSVFAPNNYYSNSSTGGLSSTYKFFGDSSMATVPSTNNEVNYYDSYTAYIHLYLQKDYTIKLYSNGWGRIFYTIFKGMI